MTAKNLPKPRASVELDGLPEKPQRVVTRDATATAPKMSKAEAKRPPEGKAKSDGVASNCPGQRRLPATDATELSDQKRKSFLKSAVGGACREDILIMSSTL